MVGESFHPRGCWGEDSDHIRLGATAQKLSRLFAFLSQALKFGKNEINAGIVDVPAARINLKPRKPSPS